MVYEIKQIREALIKERGGVCEVCKKEGVGEFYKGLEVHHIIKKKDGGTNDKSNLKVVCRKCHNLEDNQSLVCRINASNLKWLHSIDKSMNKAIEMLMEREKTIKELKQLNEGARGKVLDIFND